MPTVMEIGMSAIVGILVLLIYSLFFAALNTAAIDSGALALYAVVPILLAAIVIIYLLRGLGA